jgi:hypothetical protein
MRRRMPPTLEHTITTANSTVASLPGEPDVHNALTSTADSQHSVRWQEQEQVPESPVVRESVVREVEWLGDFE